MQENKQEATKVVSFVKKKKGGKFTNTIFNYVFKNLMHVIDKNTKICIEIAKKISCKNSLQLQSVFINAT